MSNGGIIGPPNLPTETVRSGVWTLSEQYLAAVAGEWPFLPAPELAGYVAGGNDGSVNVSTVDKFAFSDDSRTTLASGLSAARARVTGFASGAAGYAAGGLTSVTVSTVDKFAFSDDSRTTLASGLSTNRLSPAGFASSSAGYAAGGATGTSTLDAVATVDKFAFSDDSRTTLGTGLSSSRQGATGFASDAAGYAAGGLTSATAFVSTVDKFAFSNDARSTLGTGLSTNSWRHAGFASDAAGYAAGGDTTTNATGLLTTVNKFAFASDTRSTLGTGLSSGRRGPTGFASDAAGYAAGGRTSTQVTTVDKFAFSDDSRTTLGTGLSTAREFAAGFAG